MTDIISTATVTAIKADAAKVVTAVDSTETGVLAFVKAHYSKVAFAVIGIVGYIVFKKIF